ncbi:MAG TPA: hypothetical protein VK181_19530 [Rhizobium sp.]|nr:hypothetical protein [Rhizobium sp.]
MTRQEELRKMVTEATPGPWEWTKEAYDDGRCWHLSPGVLILDADGGGPNGPDEIDDANARLIAQAPTLAADLAAALDRLARLKAALQHMKWCRYCAEGDWSDCDEGRKADATLAAFLGDSEGGQV